MYEAASSFVEPITVYYAVINGGDGSAYPRWYINQEHARLVAEEEEWGEPCEGSVETFIGSDIYKDGCINDKDYEDEKREYAEALAEAKKLYADVKSCGECGCCEIQTFTSGHSAGVTVGYCSLIDYQSIKNLDVIHKDCPLVIDNG